MYRDGCPVDFTRYRIALARGEVRKMKERWFYMEGYNIVFSQRTKLASRKRITDDRVSMREPRCFYSNWIFRDRFLYHLRRVRRFKR